MKIRKGFVSNSSTASFIIELNSFNSVVDIAIFIVELMLDQDEEKYGFKDDHDDENIYVKILNNLYRLKALHADYNFSIFVPSNEFDTMIVKREDGYYINTCNNYMFDDLPLKTYDSDGFSFEIFEELETIFPYLPEYDIIGKNIYSDRNHRCQNNSEHDYAIILESGEWFCPDCNPDRITELSVLNHLDKYTDLIILSKEESRKSEEKEKRVKNLNNILEKDHHFHPDLKTLEKIADLENELNCVFRIQSEYGEICIADSRHALSFEDGSLKEIGINKVNLTEIPKTLLKFSEIEFLYLMFNRLTKLPNNMSRLTNLKGIELTGNPLTKIPKGLGTISNLEEITFFGCQIQHIDENIGTLGSIKRFTLADNKLSSISDAIGNLENLEELDLHWNELSSLPDAITSLASLKNLELYGNKIECLPDTFGDLKNLRRLNLSKNKLKVLPDSIGNMTTLERLDLDANNIETLPGNLGKLDHLSSLNLNNNPTLVFSDQTCEVIYALAEKGTRIFLPKHAPKEIEEKLDLLKKKANQG